MTLIKSISGIRGTIGGPAGENLSPPDVVKFTTAYVRLISERRPGKKLTVVVGRDARISGQLVSDLVEGTLLACGADVINVGLCTTPGTEMAVITKRADGGIIITASHNPRQWNALKLLNADGEFLSDAEGKRVLAMSEEEAYDYPAIDEIGHVLSREDFNDEHIRLVLGLPLVDVEAVRRRRFKVVVDAVNSVGGIVMPKLLRELGCEVVELNCEPTGEFAHNPEPLPQHLTEISEVIVREKADLGVVVDPDVDRLAFVSEDGSMFVEEYTLVAVADYILSENPGGTTVSNLSSSRALRDVTVRHGGKYYASAVGEVNVTTKMKEVGAVIGGEGNGGVIYPGLHYGRDALVGTALFLTWLARKGMTMTQLRATYPAYYASKNKIELTPAIDVDKVLREVKERYAGEKVNDIDGVKIDFAENWVHLRKSNTEPIIRVYTEAKSMDEADALAQRFIAEIKGICGI
ncbi:MAG TPA: phosphoglucosamine mutase [Candidatus Alistipes faecavium]|uniref:phosphoglucosamine mutase n=1 Tax=uncultured Alistipes sp. TaxID=538949 RepID=UPI001F86DC5C|nr:phosphoglucosamine mutase [uncultured Alistipes sp.]HJA96553.1 phosphoglucosamine mutase [Candidatus Alistipes faecavium]